MSQNDFTIADQTFPNFRADLNLALQALASLSSGATAPTVPFANQLWYETDTNTLWIRNELNTAWLDLLRIDQTTGSPSFMSGNVGIGTTSPSRAFHLKNSAAFMRLEDADTGVSTIYAEIQVDTVGSLVLGADSGNAAAGTAIQFYLDASEKARITSTGNLGLGTASPARVLHVKNTNPTIRMEDSDTGVSTIYAEIDTTTAGSLFLKADPGNAAAGSNIQFEIDATELLRIGPSGQIGIAGANYGTAGQPLVSGGSGSVAWGPLLSNGTYTPTLTSVANVAASTANVCQWLRVGNTVTVSGSIAVTATAVSTDTEIGISIPVASNFAGGANLGGTGASTSTGTFGQSGAMLADATNDRARFLLRPTVGTSIIYGFSFTYQVI